MVAPTVAGLAEALAVMSVLAGVVLVSVAELVGVVELFGVVRLVGVDVVATDSLLLSAGCDAATVVERCE